VFERIRFMSDGERLLLFELAYKSHVEIDITA